MSIRDELNLFRQLSSNRIFGNLIFLSKILVHKNSVLLFDPRLKCLEWKSLILIETLHNIQKHCTWIYKGDNKNMKVASMLASTKNTNLIEVSFNSYEPQANYAIYLLHVDNVDIIQTQLVRFNVHFYKLNFLQPNIINPCDGYFCIIMEKLENKIISLHNWEFEILQFTSKLKDLQDQKLQKANTIFQNLKHHKEFLDLRTIYFIIFIYLQKYSSQTSEWIYIFLKNKLDLLQ